MPIQLVLSQYSIDNLVRSAQFLADLTKTLSSEISAMERIKADVVLQQRETHKQGMLVRKMTDYLSDELGRIEMSLNDNASHSLNKKLSNLNETETKLRLLRGRLDEFVSNDDAENLKKSDTTLVSDLKRYEAFLLDLTSMLNEKIPQIERITDRARAETREAQQQKLLLKEMTDLFNTELEELDSAFCEIRGNTVS
ncbi:hypothetical protein [Candidatus Nitrosotenuis uzonensis]|uniref:Uncharacterized protein n=1 Tax=Candidatus Nitrosotenuis uzonensis TaxID=1407055 RepID=V6AVZ6_9ARCH|nr:hypothetical protein [Candidatus Nitrosotenuis uzonensis]CAE6489981.1 conserved hypothetical protein [Candidatus Nitrosotenuis uzonensis]CDI06734.1 hypothetical protein NITUZ_60261 [Candidatus Nitrosotenuis uzonensis]